MPTVEVAAVTATALLVLVALYQVGLAVGMPLGEATMGGRAKTTDGVLTQPYRFAALASATLLLVAAALVLARGGVLPLGLPSVVVQVGAWIIVAFMLLNTLTNLTGRHPIERWGLSGVALIVAGLTAYIALVA